MKILNPTPRDRMLDAKGRPYFLWDVELTLDSFIEHLRSGSEKERAYLIGKLMRQAKPDDVFEFVTLREIRELWPQILPFLGNTREFWIWLVGIWNRMDGYSIAS